MGNLHRLMGSGATVLDVSFVGLETLVQGCDLWLEELSHDVTRSSEHKVR